MPAPIQHASIVATPTSGTTATASPVFSSPLTAGNAVVACITVLGSAATPTITSVKTGTLAENWVLAKAGTAETTQGHLHVEGWVNPNTGGGGTTINVAVSFSATLSSSNNGCILVDIYEVPNVVTSGAVDKTSGGGSSSSSSFTSGTTAVTTSPTEIVFGVACAAVAFTSSITPPGTYTNQTVLTDTFGGFSEEVSHVSGYLVLSATGTQSYAGTNASGSANSAAVFSLFQVSAVTGTGAITSTSPDAISGTGTGPATGTGAITSTSPDRITGAGGSAVGGSGAITSTSPDRISGGGGSISGSGGLTGAADLIHGVGGQLPSGGGNLNGATDRIHGTGTATPPGLVIAITPQAGTDDFGNDYPAGVTVFLPVTAGGQTGTYAITLGDFTSPYTDFAALTFTNQTNPADMPPAILAASDSSGSGLELVSGNAIGATPAQIDLLDSSLGGVAGGLLAVSAGLLSLSGQLTAGANIDAPTINGVPLTQGTNVSNVTPVSGSPPSGSGTAIASAVSGALNTYFIALAGNLNTLSSVVSALIVQLANSGVIA